MKAMVGIKRLIPPFQGFGTMIIMGEEEGLRPSLLLVALSGLFKKRRSNAKAPKGRHIIAQGEAL